MDRCDIYKEVALFGIPALFTEERLEEEKIPEGFVCYECRKSEIDPGIIATVENTVWQNFGGSILTIVEIPFLSHGERLKVLNRLQLDWGNEIDTPTFRQRWEPVLSEPAVQAHMIDEIIKVNEQLVWAGHGGPRATHADTYAIYQATDSAPYLFMDYKCAAADLCGAHYVLKYGGLLSEKMSLDDIYAVHNRDNRPSGMVMRSLSMSDIIVINRGQELSAYYVDTFGFEKLDEGFIIDREYLAETEEAIADYYFREFGADGYNDRSWMDDPFKIPVAYGNPECNENIDIQVYLNAVDPSVIIEVDGQVFAVSPLTDRIELLQTAEAMGWQELISLEEEDLLRFVRKSRREADANG